MKEKLTAMGDSLISVSTNWGERSNRSYEGEFIIYLKHFAIIDKKVPKYLQKKQKLPDSVERMKNMIYVKSGSFSTANKIVGFKVGRSTFSWSSKFVNKITDINGKLLWHSSSQGIDEDIPEDASEEEQA